MKPFRFDPLGAYANFEENEKGSIEVGKFADFIILDQDIMKVKIERVLNTRIVALFLTEKLYSVTDSDLIWLKISTFPFFLFTIFFNF